MSKPVYRSPLTIGNSKNSGTLTIGFRVYIDTGETWQAVLHSKLQSNLQYTSCLLSDASHMWGLEYPQISYHSQFSRMCKENYTPTQSNITVSQPNQNALVMMDYNYKYLQFHRRQLQGDRVHCWWFCSVLQSWHTTIIQQAKHAQNIYNFQFCMIIKYISSPKYRPCYAVVSWLSVYISTNVTC